MFVTLINKKIPSGCQERFVHCIQRISILPSFPSIAAFFPPAIVLAVGTFLFALLLHQGKGKVG